MVLSAKTDYQKNLLTEAIHLNIINSSGSFCYNDTKAMKEINVKKKHLLFINCMTYEIKTYCAIGISPKIKEKNEDNLKNVLCRVEF